MTLNSMVALDAFSPTRHFSKGDRVDGRDPLLTTALEDSQLLDNVAAVDGVVLPDAPSGRRVEIHIHMMSFGPAPAIEGEIATAMPATWRMPSH